MLLFQATEQAKEETKKVLSVLNQHLNTRTFLVGERVSLADVSVACAMLWLYKQVRNTQRDARTNMNVLFLSVCSCRSPSTPSALSILPAGAGARLPPAVPQRDTLVHHLRQPAPVQGCAGRGQAL